MKKLFFVLFLGLSSIFWSASSFAYRSTVFAVNTYGTIELNISSRNICILPGYKLRMRPDVMSYNGHRYYYPAYHFIWQANYSNGYWERWDARYGSPGYGPFSYAPQSNSVYFSAYKNAMGPAVKVELGHANFPIASFLIVDPLHPQNIWNCEWLADTFYVNSGQGNNPPPNPIEPPPELVPEPIIPEACRGKCEEGKYCTDGCLYLADCEFISAHPKPYWKVRSCMQNLEF